MNRNHPAHEDLGLVDNDNTEDMRKAPAVTEALRSDHPSSHHNQQGDLNTMKPQTECQHCTVPSEGDTCGFCKSYTPPAQTWRELASQLPPHVVQRFERYERLTELHGPLAFPEEDPAEVIRNDQALMLEEARNQIPFADVPLPASATGGDLWEDDGDGNWSRVLDGRSRSTGPLSVNITGVQLPDGSVSWSVSACAKDHDVSPALVREFAAQLIEAADEVDRLRAAS